MKMYDVGHKMSMEMTVGKSEKNKKNYPTVYISDKELPILKGKDIGDKINLLIECEIKGVNMHARSKEDKKTNYDLEIKRAGEESETKMSQAIDEATNEKEEKYA